MLRVDTENHYHWLCVLRGHRWQRPYYPDDYDRSWFRETSCHRCEHILMGTELIAERWRRHNDRAREDGCKCGRPATKVHYYGPSAVWSCAEHEGVNQWWMGPDGAWAAVLPTEEEAATLAQWETAKPRPYSPVDAIRGGVFEVVR